MSSLKALIVEDAPGDAYFIKKILQSMGYECEMAHSYYIATLLLKKTHYQIMILDINLPGKSGIDLLNTFDIYNENKPDKIIVITGTKVTPKMEEVLEGKVDYLLTKSNDMQNLKKLINDLTV